MKFSEVIRSIIDFALDRDATLGLPLYADRMKSLQAELSSTQEAIRSLEQQASGTPKVVLKEVANPTNRKASPKTAHADKRVNRPDQTAEEQWRVKLEYVLNPPANLSRESIEEIKASVADTARAHPEWVDRLSVAQQAEFKGKLKLPEPDREGPVLAEADNPSQSQQVALI